MIDNKYDPERAKKILKGFSKPVVKNYESPVEIFYQETLPKINDSVDSVIVQTVCNVGVDVNKEELIKALAYDREQYEKGYINGYKEGYKQALSDITGRFNDKFKEILEEANTDVKTTTE